jgi:hypothetical protein
LLAPVAGRATTCTSACSSSARSASWPSTNRSGSGPSGPPSGNQSARRGRVRSQLLLLIGVGVRHSVRLCVRCAGGGCVALCGLLEQAGGDAGPAEASARRPGRGDGGRDPESEAPRRCRRRSPRPAAAGLEERAGGRSRSCSADQSSSAPSRSSSGGTAS